MLHAFVDMETLLRTTRTIAVLGAKDKEGSPVDRVGRHLIARGFTVFPVHPARRDVWGLPTYKTLADIPHPVDMVNLFRNAQYCPEHARETLALSPLPRCFWMQSGIVSPEARALLEPAGVQVVEDACLMIEHAALFPPASQGRTS